MSEGAPDEEMSDEGGSAEDVRSGGGRGPTEQFRSGVGPGLGLHSIVETPGKKAVGAPKSAYPNVSGAAHQDVCGVNVTVNQGVAVSVALAMGVGQGIENGVGHEHRCIEVQGLIVDA